MSLNARKLSTDPKFERRRRKRRQRTLLARVYRYQGADAPTVRLIFRRRVRAEKYCAANICKAPGVDGYEWFCDCAPTSRITPTRGMRGRSTASACVHLTNLLNGEYAVNNDTLSWDNSETVALTAAGDEILRPIWATATLKSMGKP